MPPQHVLIVGGGIAGLALGIGLARCGIKSTIFEIRSSDSEQGGSVTLATPALRVLDHNLGIYEQIKAAGWTYRRMSAYNDEGYHFGEMDVSEQGKEDGYPAVRIMRGALREVLLDQYAQAGPLGKIVFGARLERIESGEAGVIAHFEDGPSEFGDLIIGADGIHSKIRAHILGVDAPSPVFAGTGTVNSFLPRSSIPTPPDFSIPSMIFTPIGLVMLMPVDVKGDTITWGLTEEMEDKQGRQGWKDYEQSGEVVRSARQKYASVTTDPIKGLMERMDQAEVRLWPHYSIPDLPIWHNDRACLIGDAAHALPPNGQGIGMALEDAAFLARLLNSEQAVNKGYEKLFSHFEVARRERVAQIMNATKASGTIKAKSGPWGWWLKQWGIYAFFAWHKWVVKGLGHQGKFTVDTENIVVR